VQLRSRIHSAQKWFMAHALHLRGDIAAHPDGSDETSGDFAITKMMGDWNRGEGWSAHGLYF
jgi:hypothetical protein